MTFIKFPPLIPAILIKRINRFSVLASVDNKEEQVFLPNSGRMKELLIAGATLWLEQVDGDHRKTKYDLILVDNEGKLVSLDSRVPNILVGQTLREGQISEWGHIKEVKGEKTFGKSRFDFWFRTGTVEGYIETKSVTLVDRGLGKFPDAPTERGTKHVRELIEAKSKGLEAGIFFIIQRDDARGFTPHQETDPLFAEALWEAFAAGVSIKAFSCKVEVTGIALGQEIPLVRQSF